MRDRLLILTSVASLFCVTASAAEWFVSPDGTDADGRGAEAEPFHTIQYAIGKANAGDTIVLLPGDYGADQGTTTTTVSGNSSANRVVIDKTLTIIGRDGRDKTRIVGAWDTAEYTDRPYGFGSNAVRCVWIDSTASGTRLEGITFYKGSVPTYTSSSGGNTYGGGGGVLVNANDTTATIIDCAFIDCQAFNGGGLCHSQQSTNVKAVRCLFKRCRGSKYGSAMRGGSAYNCIFDDNGRTRLKSGEQMVISGQMGNDGSGGAMSYPKYVVNCTFVNNDNIAIGTDNASSMRIYNCIFANNGYVTASTGAKTARAFSTSATYANCVSDISTITANDCTNVAFTTSSEVYSPFDGDYRLVSDASSLTSGSTTYLSNIPEEFRDTDFCGNARTTDDAVYCGAVQDVADAAASGVLLRRQNGGTWIVGGETNDVNACTWKASEGWPAPALVQFAPTSGVALVRYTMNSSPLWPRRDGSVWVAAEKAGAVSAVTPVTTANVVWADPDSGDDDTADGTEAAPYKTLQAAVTAAADVSGGGVVYAKAGDYAEGGTTALSLQSRVVFPSTLSGDLRIVAVDGPEATFITGAADGSATDGLGSGGVRCVAVLATGSNRAAVQGFTLRDGHTTSASNAAGQGGALASFDSSSKDLGTAWLLDCTVTNCAAARGVAFGGTLLRCRVADCAATGSNNGILRGATAVSSLFTGCGRGSSGSSVNIVAAASYAWNCTFYGNSIGTFYQSATAGLESGLRNCVSAARTSGSDLERSTAFSAGWITNTVYESATSATTVANLGETVVCESPVRFIDGTGGDYRLAPDSAGLALANANNMQSCMDVDGTPFTFDADTGAYQAGCFASRPASDFTTLYVDAANGSDANDGSSESAAFQTLAAAIAAADYGDTVIALPGTYDNGTTVPTLGQSCHTNAPTLPARVVVKGGVMLVSRDGAETTIIKGASAATDNGCGDGAVRGVFLCAGATLRGFTVTGGRTLGGTSFSMDDAGGGICGAYSSTDGDASQWRGLVENCIISNNISRTGGGAQYGTYRNCRFENNSVYKNMGHALCRGSAEGCVFKGNGPSDGTGHSVCYDTKVVNCTLLGGQAGADTSNRGLVLNEGNASRLPILNSIVLGNYATGTSTNNYILSTASNTSTLATKYESGNVTGDASVVDEDGVPVAGAAVIDAGDASFCSAECLAGRDLVGTRRILNSTIDIGAFEYDWGVPWAKALGSRRLTIDDMPSGAALVGNRLAIAEGAVLMTWEKGTTNAPYIYNVRVTGSGTLTVTVNGEVVGMYTAANGAQELRFTSDLVANALQFVYVSGDGDTGGAELYGFSHTSGLIILLR